MWGWYDHKWGFWVFVFTISQGTPTEAWPCFGDVPSCHVWDFLLNSCLVSVLQDLPHFKIVIFRVKTGYRCKKTNCKSSGAALIDDSLFANCKKLLERNYTDLSKIAPWFFVLVSSSGLGCQGLEHNPQKVHNPKHGLIDCCPNFGLISPSTDMKLNMI